MHSLGYKWNKPFYKRYDKKHRAPNEKYLDFMIDYFRLEMALKLAIDPKKCITQQHFIDFAEILYVLLSNSSTFFGQQANYAI